MSAEARTHAANRRDGVYEDEAPRRLTPTERLHEVTMAAMSRPRAESEQSCTITRNARGIVQFEITVRGPYAAEVSDQARALFDELVVTYPYPDANGGTE